MAHVVVLGAGIGGMTAAYDLRGELNEQDHTVTVIGDTGAAFVAIPQIPPRNVTWSKEGKWVHLAKVAYEKYFLNKMKRGGTEPVYEKYILKMLGINRLKSEESTRTCTAS